MARTTDRGPVLAYEREANLATSTKFTKKWSNQDRGQIKSGDSAIKGSTHVQTSEGDWLQPVHALEAQESVGRRRAKCEK